MLKKIFIYLTPLFFALNINADDLTQGHEAMKKGDYKSAFTLYSKACDNNNLKACGAVGVMYERELGRKQDYKKALELYNQVCDGGEMSGCGMLAMHYAAGKIIKQDLPKAIDLYKKSCNGKHTKSCLNLGGLYYLGKGVEKDIAQAKKLFQKACDLGSAEGCKNVKVLGSENTTKNPTPKATASTPKKTNNSNDKKAAEEAYEQAPETPQSHSGAQLVIDGTIADKVNAQINTAKHAYTGKNTAVINSFKDIETLDDQFQRAVIQKKDSTILKELLMKINHQVSSLVVTLENDPSQAQAASALKEISLLVSDK